MNIVYVGVDLGSSNFHQVAVNEAGVSKVNREFATSEANLIKAFADLFDGGSTTTGQVTERANSFLTAG